MKEIMFVLMVFGAMGSVYAHAEKSLILLDTITVTNHTLKYLVTDTKANIILDISTQDPRTIMFILHHGLTVYFDVKGKEKKKVWITYPKEPLPMSSFPQEEASEDFQTDAEVMQKRQAIYRLVSENFPEDAVFIHNEKTDFFNVLLNSLDVTAAYTYNTGTGILNYHLTVPKHKIIEKANQDLSKLKIGVVTTNKEKPSKIASSGFDEFDTDERESGSRRGGPPGGGRGPSGQSQGGGHPDESESSAPIELDFWFDAHL
ncbi:hypothetical protein FNB79_13540 [Formosa sediminum]|uniref:Uncharacterized protein n=1 Tax=Formosa sediminum TaxID=2594004 RepID=A0A516GTV6_9FLAO|nr:hypothetical protein [Formosa sediminum]QDO94948.1 hypothetical protein FNB79_13540 [Formosa sediminum]